MEGIQSTNGNSEYSGIPDLIVESLINLDVIFNIRRRGALDRFQEREGKAERRKEKEESGHAFLVRGLFGGTNGNHKYKGSPACPSEEFVRMGMWTAKTPRDKGSAFLVFECVDAT